MLIAAPAASVWNVFRDIAAVHTRLAPGFVVDCRMDGKDRIVTFANGVVVREVIVHIGDDTLRLAYSVRSEKLTHHNASFQVFPVDGGSCRVVWIADLLPDAMAETFEPMMQNGMTVMKSTLERHA
jgi:hypothetical protein